MSFWDSLKTSWRKGLPWSVYALEHADPSVYGRISECVVDDELPSYFRMWDQDRIGGNVFYDDGARDGLALHLFGLPTLSQEAKERVGAAVVAASDGDFENASSLFCDLAAEYRVVGIIDEIQAQIFERLPSLDEDVLGTFAAKCVAEAAAKPLPKVGLSILELYGEPSMKLKLAMRTLGLSDEYTLFVMWNMRHWKFASTELFNLAKKVHGWGRIHIVNEIEADTDDIRRWLLLNGVDNRVAAFECAAACFVKSDAMRYLRSGMTYEEFVAVGKILAGLVEGPKSDVSEVEGWQDAIRLYAMDARRHELVLEDYGRLQHLAEHAAACGFEGFEEPLDSILRSKECVSCVAKAVEKGEGIESSMPSSDFSSTESSMRSALEERIKAVMAEWDDEGIYVISLWVTSWDDNPYEPIVILGYNTEAQVSAMTPKASSACEARWNFAFWLQNEELSFGGNLHKTPGDSPALVARWVRSAGFGLYTAQELESISLDDADEAISDGEGVTEAFYEVLVDVVRDLRSSGFIRDALGRDVPVIIHDLEYAEGIAERNIEANGDVLPAEFVAYCNGEC